MHNVLIVDEEEHLLSALEQDLFPDRDDIAILTATNGEEGLEHLKNSRIDLLISDIKMPGKIDGFQLILRAKEIAPDARVIIITAFGSNRVQNFAERIGITHYIEKPFNTDELRDAVLEILDEKEGFQGVLNDLELTDIIQMLCLARRTALLHLKHRDRRGRIVFQNGDVIHAEFDGLIGEDAVFKMLALRQGDIFMQSDFKNDERTIEIGWQDLLFEGVRRADEERANLPDEDSEAEDDGPGTDVGMGITEEALDAAIGASFDEGNDESFFSSDELAEIEAAAEANNSLDLPLATLADDLEEDSFTDSPRPPTSDFKSPFRREKSSIVSPAAVSAKTTTGLPTVTAVDATVLQARLEEFALQCPGLKESVIVDAARGIALASVVLEESFDANVFASSSADITQAAQRTIEALGAARFRELHVTVGDDFLVVATIEDTPYHHVALVGHGVSLGVALVMMKRLQHGVLRSLERA